MGVLKSKSKDIPEYKILLVGGSSGKTSMIYSYLRIKEFNHLNFKGTFDDPEDFLTTVNVPGDGLIKLKIQDSRHDLE